MTNISQDVLDQLQRLMPREARWAYWQDGNGPMFVYNTERIRSLNPNDPGNGKFESAVFMPVGPGSRSGKATEWQVDQSTRSLHALRKDAKARAYRLYQEWQESQ